MSWLKKMPYALKVTGIAPHAVGGSMVVPPFFKALDPPLQGPFSWVPPL